MIFNLVKHAKQLLFDNSKNGLSATNTQDAIDELKGKLPILKSKTVSGTTSQFGNTQQLLSVNQIYDKCQLTTPSSNHFITPAYFNGQKVFSLYTAAQTSRQALANTAFEGTIWYWEIPS